MSVYRGKCVSRNKYYIIEERLKYIPIIVLDIIYFKYRVLNTLLLHKYYNVSKCLLRWRADELYTAYRIYIIIVYIGKGTYDIRKTYIII